MYLRERPVLCFALEYKPKEHRAHSLFANENVAESRRYPCHEEAQGALRERFFP
jgi:hypothetical protein